MFGTEALRHQDLDGPAEQLLAAVAEELLALGVDQDDVDIRVDHDDGVGRGLDDQPEPLFGLPALGDVLHHRGHAEDPAL